MKSIILIIHIAAGSFALLSGLVAIIATKGKTLHIAAGKIYFWSILMVAISAIGLSIYSLDLFLFSIALFTLQLAGMGFRIYQLRNQYKDYVKPAGVDWFLGVAPLFVNITILVWGVWYIIGSNYFGLTGIIFGSIGLIYSLLWLSILKKPPAENAFWVLFHIQTMGASYIAISTAFIVVNVNFLDPLFIWLAPSIIGTALIIYTAKRWKRKLTISAISGKKIHSSA